jgi:predicted NBD/HSP70 family sugar kinase
MRGVRTTPRATPRTARLINDRVAYDLLLERGPLTRSQLRAMTGLAGPTVSDLVQRMEQAGLIASVGEAGSERRGPNALLYGVVADRAHVVGVEVQTAHVIAAVTDVTGEPVGTAEIPQDSQLAPDKLVGTAVEAALADAGLAEAGTLHAIVVGTPGLVDPATGDVSYVASLPTWRADANLLPALRAQFGVPVRLENEVNLVGIAEHRLGAARGRDSFALLSLGEGLGVAVVLDGKLYRGASGGAGEVGYVPLGDGTFQQLVGGAAVRELEAAHDRQRGRAYLDELADRVALGAASVCAVLDPGFLVLAGSLGRWGGADLADRVAARLAELTPLRTEVVATTVRGNPVVRGAVRVALDLVHAQTFGS